MAVTLVSQPTTPNVTGTKLLFEVSGSDISHPQYAYVMDIYLSGSSVRIDRQFQQPNPDGVAEFNPAEVLRSQLDYDNFWKTTEIKYPISASKTFDLRFGEAYGTSISSSLTIYTGSTNNYLQVIPGVVDPNSGNYNFNTSSFNVTTSQYLTNQPAYYFDNRWISDTQYHTKADYLTATQFEDPVGDTVVFTGYLTLGKNSTSITSSTFTPNPVNNPEYPNQRFTTVPYGPKNLIDSDNGWKQLIESGSINFIESISDYGRVKYFIRDNIYNNDAIEVDFDTGLETIEEDSLRLPLNREYLQFAFINKYGFYDYYNIYNPLRRRSELTRNIVSLPKVNYSSTVSTYSYETGGEFDYHRDTNDFYSITTDWLNKQFANWLEELLESPEVFVRQGDNYVPIVITNTQYQHNNSEGRNKLFQYTIDFVPSNGREIVQESYNDKRATFCTVQGHVIPNYPTYAFLPLGDAPWHFGPETYDPYWRLQYGGLVPLPIASSSVEQDGPISKFIYTPTEISTTNYWSLSGSFASQSANFYDLRFELDIIGDENTIFTTSSRALVDVNNRQYLGNYQYQMPYTASFTSSFYSKIQITGSVSLYTYPLQSNLSRFNNYWVGPSTLDNSYNLTLTDSFYNSSSIANIQRPSPTSDDIEVTTYRNPYTTLQLQPDYTIPTYLTASGYLEITGSGTLVSGSITQSINNSTTGSWIVEGIDEDTRFKINVVETVLPPLDTNLYFYWDSKNPEKFGQDPDVRWYDTKTNNWFPVNGPYIDFVTGSIPPFTGSFYRMNSNLNVGFIDGALPANFFGSGARYSFQSWFMVTGSDSNVVFYAGGGVQFPSGSMAGVSVVTSGSGGNCILGLAGQTGTESEGIPGRAFEYFTDLVVEKDVWNMVTLVRQGDTFDTHALYLNTGSAYYPSGSFNTIFNSSANRLEIGRDQIRDTFPLDGYLANLLFYQSKQLNTTEIERNYIALKAHLETNYND